MADVQTPPNPSEQFSVWFDEPCEGVHYPDERLHLVALGGFPAHCRAQLIRKQRSVVVCIQSNPRRYKIDKNKSLAVAEDAGHDLPYWWLNFEFLRRRRCHVLRPSRKQEHHSNRREQDKQLSLNTAASLWWISALGTPSTTKNLFAVPAACLHRLLTFWIKMTSLMTLW